MASLAASSLVLWACADGPVADDSGAATDSGTPSDTGGTGSDTGGTGSDTGGTSDTGGGSDTGQGNRAPAEPTALAPRPDATEVPVDTTLSWRCPDPDGDPVTAEVRLGTGRTLPVVAEALEDPVFDPAEAGLTLDGGTVYRWSVTCSDGDLATAGPDWSFTTACADPCAGAPTVTDADGTAYDTLAIGCQCWMAENLAVGLRIDVDPNRGFVEQADDGTRTRFCQDNRDAECDRLGGLYQWDEAVGHGDPADAVCPSGWHLPTDEEWQELERAVGMSASEAAKESSSQPRGTTEGTALSVGGSTGFDAPAAGLATFAIGTFYDTGDSTAHFWTATDRGDTAYRRRFADSSGGIFRDRADKTDAYSVRCVRDR